jgi:hypothetical protein
LEREADRLVKALSQYLFLDFPFEDLRVLGWYDFLQYDRPLTDDPVEMGCTAFLYLFGRASLNTRLHGARRVIAFVCGENGRDIPAPDTIPGFLAIIQLQELDRGQVYDWLDGNCR